MRHLRPLAVVGLLAMAGVIILGAWAPAMAEKRVALVIGNNAYETLPPLVNAANDAESISVALEQAGFEVITLLNANRTAIFRAKAEFENKLARADAGLIFYAGHGIQAQGINWLIPVDAQIKIEADLPAWGIDAQDLLAVMEGTETPVNILILDACRDNPLPKRTRSAARGLRALTPRSSATGIVVYYAAGEGQTAQDGPKGGNGVFTGALLKTMATPGLTLEQVFKRTAAQVVETTGGEQRPWYHGSLTGDFFFTEKNIQRAAVTSTPTPTPKTTGEGSMANQQEIVFWQSVKDSENKAEIEAFLKAFPDGVFAPLAKLRLKQLEEKATQPEPAKTTTQPPRGPEILMTETDPAPLDVARQGDVGGVPGGPIMGKTPLGGPEPLRSTLPAAPPPPRPEPGPQAGLPPPRPEGGQPPPGGLNLPESIMRETCGGRASFDCAKAETSVESAICENPHARQLDCWLGATYKAAQRSVGGDKGKLRDDQKKWIALRERMCGKLKDRRLQDCIRKSTEHRINVLKMRYALGR